MFGAGFRSVFARMMWVSGSGLQLQLRGFEVGVVLGLRTCCRLWGSALHIEKIPCWWCGHTVRVWKPTVKHEPAGNDLLVLELETQDVGYLDPLGPAAFLSPSAWTMPFSDPSS